ncbi:hypothetical protein M115_1788 [Bacteroides fragilis str. 3719 T6]|nr:hypothetical protein M085_5038 [Bacteroides fragilis str. 3986 N(B)19]EYA48141.1 hypothetical protein M115_1788 [Bacteroides fragilis str. 3719 T6]
MSLPLKGGWEHREEFFDILVKIEVASYPLLKTDYVNRHNLTTI